MKKICILSAVNIKHMSLISIYTEWMKEQGMDFDIVYMDKYGEEEFFPAKKKYVFKNVINSNFPKLIRGLYYYKFIGFAKKILKKNQYDFIIVWNDVAIFLFANYLAKHWENMYCLNIRDYCHQKNNLIYKLFEKVIKNSAFTTLSSPGFKSFLPEHDYLQLNSLNMSILDKCTPRTRLRNKNEKIRITFVGNVRFYAINKRLMDIFRNDPRFELHYYGTHAEVLKEYAKQNGIKNTVFGGSFPVEDTYKYIDKIDIINNLYGNGNMSVDYALSIKLYYGIYSRLPILVEPNTYMEEITTQIGIGYVVQDLADDLNDKLYEWYQNIDFRLMDNNCISSLEEIVHQNKLIYEKLAEQLLG